MNSIRNTICMFALGIVIAFAPDDDEGNIFLLGAQGIVKKLRAVYALRDAQRKTR